MTPMRAFDLTQPAAPALPIVIDSPHSGTDYPADFEYCAPMRLLRMAEDTWVERLWANAPAHGATLLAARFPRSYIDPNRSLLDIDAALLDAPWPGPVSAGRKTELGIGLVWRLLDDTPIYDRRLSVAEVQQRIEECWRPYHAALESALDSALLPTGASPARGACRWHLNVHSMGDDAYRRLGLPIKPLADFVLGNLDGTTSDQATMDVLAAPLRAHGFSVAFNDPFKGVEIIRNSGQPEVGRHAVQVEVKRSLYMNERFEPVAGYARVQAAIDALLTSLATHVRARCAPAAARRSTK
jgi:N-formylglutamate deformylase